MWILRAIALCVAAVGVWLDFTAPSDAMGIFLVDDLGQLPPGFWQPVLGTFLVILAIFIFFQTLPRLHDKDR
ncbi:hypothetical protein [Subtercola boreus]|uniref:Uncharacterized protein n=1 Tax=Subtercola boreus TaxID=120213 RepID=A0A3E0WD02_9MICO|nr:hypothetical protein [Subtercola boreus]RFA21181.1 hypothetical protein B7R24_07265 [Subtercola boreus]RFA21564.1 hypothetical protein B7R23_07210 [Subtercola boreus]RFA27534.1 hypothetical protein B7R25_07335 [Subtercola boreus]